jgi:CHAT domain-containing protein/lipopolysaccharide biosynthesis regulator YciM
MARKRHLLFRSIDTAVVYRHHWRVIRWAIISLLTAVWVLFSPASSLSCSKSPSLRNLGSCLAAHSDISQTSAPQTSAPQPLIERGKMLYEAGQFNQAIVLLQQAIQLYRSQADGLGAAIALRNLALVYQQTGNWNEARTAIVQSLELLHQQMPKPAEALAQTLELQGELHLTAGDPEAALTNWEQAAVLYTQLHDPISMGRTTIRQAEALQMLGLYQRATDRLEQLLSEWQTQPDSILLSVALRHLGDALRLSGQFPEANTALQQSLAIANRLNNSEAQAATLISLGNLNSAQNSNYEARLNYQQAADRTTTPLSRIQAQLNLADATRKDGLLDQSRALIVDIAVELDQLPLSRASLYAQLNYTEQWLSLVQLAAEPEQPSPTAVLPIAQRLTTIQQQASHLGDRKAESFALGQLGALYEQAKQWPEAKQLTEEALNLSEQIRANEISYRWDWQLGRILQANGEQTEAITAYTNAIATLQLLRSDLVGVNADLQLSFRKNAEPIHRELVSLLLSHEANAVPSPDRLEQARQTIESLQLAELENFFRAACLNAQPVQLDQLDPEAAVLYPILLPDRLEVILSLPQQPLLHRTIPVAQTDVIQTVNQLKASILQQPDVPQWPDQAVALEATLYDWLIRPLRDELDRSAVKTIVFVLDGALQTIPMAVLYDGQHYLIEHYSLALAPGLQLLPSANRQRQRLDVLMLGLSEPRQNFSELPAVKQELDTIQAVIDNRGEILLNQDFTLPNLEAALEARPAPIVHLATHAQAGGNLETTFIVTWDGEIQVNQLSTLLQTANLNRRQPIELLVMSACQTAVGDERATLGLAGIAVRAGARSTMATLWSVSDPAMAQLMGQFYANLAQTNVTKAEALRQAQLALLQNPSYRHPFYWSPVILLGNWA